uniref:Kinesin-associated microtubule-binding domain-containing protein n=1 Tax=Romanomermis culicivorax TaxID=13658 RepID=A0A915J0Q2_ROMCU
MWEPARCEDASKNKNDNAYYNSITKEKITNVTRRREKRQNNTICASVADFCKKQNDEFIARVNSSALTINNCLNDITELNNRHNEETLNSIQSFAVQYSGSWANFKKSLNDKRNNQALMFNNIHQNFDASKKEQLEMMSDLQKINDLLNSVQTRQKRLFETNFNEIENQSASFVVGEDRITADIEEHEEIMKKQYVDARSVEARRCVENKSRFDELISRPLTLCVSTTRLCQEFKDKAESFSKNVEEEQTRARTELDNYVSKTSAFENNSLANNMNLIKNVVDKHHIFLRTTLSDSKVIDAAVSAVDANFQNFTDNAQSVCAAFASKQQSTVQNLSTDAEMYLSEKLASYKPTGETPARQTFIVPNKLVVTSPHETLLKRYRQERPLLDLDENAVNVDCAIDKMIMYLIIS